MDRISSYDCDPSIREICDLRWEDASIDTLTSVAWAYYFFSIQFRENLNAARSLLPDDQKLIQLEEEECDTANLSPWPCVAKPGERMNHDEFMRRTLELSPVTPMKQAFYSGYGTAYLDYVRAMPLTARAASIGSYEGGGLEAVFRAFLTAPNWEGPLLQAFRHFLIQHIRFDSDVEHGHSALSRHLAADRYTSSFWHQFRDLLVLCAPELSAPAEAPVQPGIPPIFAGVTGVFTPGLETAS
jgi:hypothetical protein